MYITNAAQQAQTQGHGLRQPNVGLAGTPEVSAHIFRSRNGGQGMSSFGFSITKMLHTTGSTECWLRSRCCPRLGG